MRPRSMALSFQHGQIHPHIDRGVEEYAGDNSQLLAPDAGLPALTVPMGFWRDHLPVGLHCREAIF